MVLRRLTTIAVAVLLAIAVGACGVEDVTTEADTEGIWVDVGALNYQVQGSRLLEPGNQVPDQAYLKGISTAVAPPDGDEVWFTVFLRVENKTDEPVPTAREFKITDTVGTAFEPVAIDPEVNPFAYTPVTLEPDTVIPEPDGPQATDSFQGAQLLFKLPLQSYGNRPLKLTIVADDAGGPEEASVDLDV